MKVIAIKSFDFGDGYKINPGQYFGNCERILDEYGKTVYILHHEDHTGKEEGGIAMHCLKESANVLVEYGSVEHTLFSKIEELEKENMMLKESLKQIEKNNNIMKDQYNDLLNKYYTLLGRNN